MINYTAYVKTDKLLEKIWNFPELAARAPFYFYNGGSGHHDFLCFKQKGELMYPTNYLNVIDRMRLMEQKILALDTGENTCLIDISTDNPFVVYNFTTGIVQTFLSFIPRKDYASSEVLVFDRHKKPIKVGESKINPLYIISESMLFLTKTEGIQLTQKESRTLFIDMYDLDGFDILSTYTNNLETLLDPQSRLDLKTSQYTEFQRAVRKAYGRNKISSRFKKKDEKKEEKEEEVKDENSKGLIYFSNLLNNIPEVKVQTEVQIDINLTDLKISKAYVNPKQMLHFNLEVDVDERIDLLKEKITEMLGHNHYTVVLIIK